MSRFVLIPEEDLRALKGLDPQMLQRLANLVGKLSAAEYGVLDMPSGGAGPKREREELPRQWGGTPAKPVAVAQGKKYTISTSFGYADVAAAEMGDQFALDAFMPVLKRTTEIKSKRARESVRRSLDKDDRFERVKGRDGVWWRRVASRQSELPG